MNGKFLCTVKLFQGLNSEGELRIDKNGKQAILLYNVAGKVPNRNVISGTVAEREGFEIGESYLVQYTELEANEVGRRFRFTLLKVASIKDMVESELVLGKPEVINIDGTETTDETEKSKTIEIPELEDNK